MRKQFVLLAQFAISMWILPSCKKEPVAQSVPLSSGHVLEYGSKQPLAGVSFSHSTCKKFGSFGCKEWSGSAPVFSEANGYITVPTDNLHSPMSFSLQGYWSYIEGENLLGPNPGEDLPFINYHTIGSGSLEFDVQLFPQVPVSLHLVNSNSDTDSAGVVIGIFAELPGNLERTTTLPFYTLRVSDTTIHLLGYGNITNKVKVVNMNNGNFILDETHMINKGDSLLLEINY